MKATFKRATLQSGLALTQNLVATGERLLADLLKPLAVAVEVDELRGALTDRLQDLLSSDADD